jgi:tetraacyldisaccharide 4'-kinase
MYKLIDRIWYRKTLAFYLWPFIPLSWLFKFIIYLRKKCYQINLLGFKTHRFPIPLIVVGNITVGGTGKTPFIIYLYQLLKSQGYNPGIVSRGYIPFKKHSIPIWVSPQSSPKEVGDEPLLVAQQLQCPIVIAANRVQAVQTLIQAKNIDIILSDDGLQHYSMDRDIEIAIIDSTKQFGNGYCLPLGPLREPIKRLDSVDLIITNGIPFGKNQYEMKLIPENPSILQNLAGKKIHAIAGIGNPKRFFQLLRDYDIDVIEHAFPDHYSYRPEDILFPDNFPIIMTEKDAVKCTSFITSKHQVLRVKAEVNPLLEAKLMLLLSRFQKPISA